MSKRSPARSAFGRRWNCYQASSCPSVRQLVHDGINAEDNIDIKASRSSQSGVLKGSRTSDAVRKKQASILHIRWTCPPKFILNDNWLVATGDQSEERIVQEQRESGVTDLIYTHPSAVTRRQSISFDEDNIPIIPITPIEDDETDPFLKEDPSITDQKPNGEKGSLTGLKGLEADIGAAASAAFTALVKSNEQGSLIDTNLLIKILNDPKMIELLRIPHTTPQDEANVAICSPFLSNPKQEKLSMMQPDLDRQSVLHLNSLLSSAVKANEGSISSELLPPKHTLHSDKLFKQVYKESALMLASAQIAAPISDQLLPRKLESSVAPLNRASIIPLEVETSNCFTSSRQRKHSFLTSSPGSDISKLQSDMDHSYYKSLVRQHGLQRQEDGKEQRLNKVKNSLSKTCRYFNNPKGCRLGLSCPYRHQNINRAHRGFSEAPIAKRVKLNSIILRL